MPSTYWVGDRDHDINFVTDEIIDPNLHEQRPAQRLDYYNEVSDTLRRFMLVDRAITIEVLTRSLSVIQHP